MCNNRETGFYQKNCAEFLAGYHLLDHFFLSVISFLLILYFSWTLYADRLKPVQWLSLNLFFLGIFTLPLYSSEEGVLNLGLFAHPVFAVLAAVIWLNASILLRPRLPQQGSLKPLADLLCLPNSLLHQQQTAPAALPEQAAWVFILLALGAHRTYPHIWLGFYPAVLAVILCGHAISRAARRALNS